MQADNSADDDLTDGKYHDMIISKTHRKVILNLSQPAQVTTVIPTARTFDYKGHTLVAVPHKVDEAQVLRNMGYKVPSPIEADYSWSGQYTPFKAQLETSAFLTMNNRAFVLSDLGTGKSMAVLWAYDYLRAVNNVRKMLVISPLSTLERVWADEIFRHFPHLTWSTLHGDKRRRLRYLDIDSDIYIINHDGIKVIQDALRERTDIDVITVDEIAAFRNASTDRWKALHRVIANRPRVWGLTGTPTPNEPTDAWAQCRLICPENVPKYVGAFKTMTMRQLSQFKWVPKDTATDTVARAMQPSIRFSRDDCVDLPPCLFQTRHVDLSTEQKKAYREMLTSLYTEIATGTIQAVNEAVKMAKLVQLCGGAAYSRDGTCLELPAQSRINETLDIIEQANSKVIVFVPFKGMLNYVAQEIRKHYTVEVVNGETSKTERDRIFSAFQTATDPHVLVAQPAAMSHGLTLTAASVIVWYAPITSAETYTQANARITRPGQKHNQLIINIEGSPVERKLYDRLKQKQKLEGLLLEIIHDQEDF